MKIADDERREAKYQKIRNGEKPAEGKKGRVVDAGIFLRWKDFPDGLYRPVGTSLTQVQGG